jgi:hypothetical protein
MTMPFLVLEAGWYRRVPGGAVRAARLLSR